MSLKKLIPLNARYSLLLFLICSCLGCSQHYDVLLINNLDEDLFYSSLGVASLRDSIHAHERKLLKVAYADHPGIWYEFTRLNGSRYVRIDLQSENATNGLVGETLIIVVGDKHSDRADKVPVDQFTPDIGLKL